MAQCYTNMHFHLHEIIVLDNIIGSLTTDNPTCNTIAIQSKALVTAADWTVVHHFTFLVAR